MAHHRLSPSRFESDMLCPGKSREEAKYPDEPSGAAAIDGTHTHTLVEVCINDGLRDPTFYVGNTLKDDDGEFKVDKARADRAAIAIDYVAKRKVELGFAPVHAEVTLNSEWAFKRADMGGTCDIHIVGADTLEVIDYKDGMAPVDLPCVQLDLYSIMLLGMYDLTKFKTVRQTIIQPKLAFKGQDGISFIERPVSELLALIPVYEEAAVATDDPNAPLIPGASQCKYCKHKACGVRAEFALKASGISFANLDVAQQSADKDPATMSNEQIREIIEAAPLIRQMIEGVEKEALRRLDAGQIITGLKLVRGRGSRGWAIEDEAEMADKLKRMGLPKTIIWQTKLISVAQVEKAKWTKRDGTEDQLSPRQLTTLQKEYVKKSDGKLTVAPESDDREAVVKDASPLFSVVEAPTETLPSWLT